MRLRLPPAACLGRRPGTLHLNTQKGKKEGRKRKSPPGNDRNTESPNGTSTTSLDPPFFPLVPTENATRPMAAVRHQSY